MSNPRNMAHNKDEPTDRGPDKGSTHYLHNEPATLDTIFIQPVIDSNRKDEQPRRELRDPSQSSPGDAADDTSTASLRPRPLHDPRAQILTAPQYPFPVVPGYNPFLPHCYDVTRQPWINPYVPHSYKSPYKRLQPISPIYFVIFMAILFLAALIVAMFMAIYFGYKN